MEAHSSQVAPAIEGDRRAEQRFPLRLPIHIKYFGTTVTEATSVTCDISARGVYFFLDFPLREGTRVEMLLTLPADITLANEIQVRCKGRIVRVNQSPLAPKIGVAAVIEQYDFTGLK